MTEDTFILGFVARFDPQKDHANLLCALQLLRHRGKTFHCVLVGTGMDADNTELQALLRKFGVADVVSLLGRRDDVPAVMSALDVHVLSSLGEAFPNVLAEAMACGTPCVTTDVGDARYIVGATGWVVPSQNPDALCIGVEQAMHAWGVSHSLWQIRRKAAREHIANNFSIERMASAYADVWKG
jgi:glycosyltransferase involved in cell wall biosynthesis